MADKAPETAPAGTAPPVKVDIAGPDAPIEVDDLGDNDSVIEDQVSAFTASLTPSVTDYPMEHGRRYHAFRSGAYVVPNDESEMERLDLCHMLYTKTIGDKLYLAPIETNKLHRILDIGTGNGVWARMMGDMFPNAFILGNDLSPTQSQWVPPNVKFEVDDVESDWLHPTPFDFIFCRYMTVGILDWPKLVKNIYDHTSPGGWCEFQDFDLQYYSDDGSLKEDNDVLIWINMILDAARKIGRDPQPGPKLEGWVKDVGFTNVVHQKFKIPFGPWAKDPKLKEIGLYNMAQLQEGLEGFSLRLFTGVYGWTQQEVMVLIAKVRAALKNPNLHTQFDIHVVYGQKPE